MYIYDLPFEMNRELCRILDTDNDWKELAGLMSYKAFEINEIEQIAHRNSSSPSKQLLMNWGQLNHRVGELFILLYRMEHIPALMCLLPVTEGKYQLLFNKICPNGHRSRDTTVLEDRINKKAKVKVNSEESSIPLPVKLIEQGVPLPTSSKALNRTDGDESDELSSSSHDTIDSDIRAEFMKNIAAIPMLPYEELKEATNSWSLENMLGQGGFAEVFKGEWKQLTVAVKRLRAVDARDRELVRELCLNQYRHDNIVPLYGYSYGGAEVCLVYQLMCGGTLELRLRRKLNIAPLTWSQRHRIAHGVARGLQFLHTMTRTPLIHGDIKPPNILLDQCLTPKIGDFGLARKGPYGENRTHIKVSHVHGTRPYLPDEYLRSGCLSPAVDVFSFGVVLLEIASCLPAFDQTRAAPLLPVHVQLDAQRGLDLAIYEDRALHSIQNSNPKLTRDIMNLGVQCTQYQRHLRPTMLEVYKELDSMSVPKKTAA